MDDGETPTVPKAIPYPMPNDTNGDILNQLHPSPASSSSAPPAAANDSEEYPTDMEPNMSQGTQQTQQPHQPRLYHHNTLPMTMTNSQCDHHLHQSHLYSESITLGGKKEKGIAGRGKKQNTKVTPTNKPQLPYFDIANDPYFIKA